jgi:hypothetical protein
MTVGFWEQRPPIGKEEQIDHSIGRIKSTVILSGVAGARSAAAA